MENNSTIWTIKNNDNLSVTSGYINASNNLDVNYRISVSEIKEDGIILDMEFPVKGFDSSVCQHFNLMLSNEDLYKIISRAKYIVDTTEQK